MERIIVCCRGKQVFRQVQKRPQQEEEERMTYFSILFHYQPPPKRTLSTIAKARTVFCVFAKKKYTRRNNNPILQLLKNRRKKNAGLKVDNSSTWKMGNSELYLQSTNWYLRNQCIYKYSSYLNSVEKSSKTRSPFLLEYQHFFRQINVFTKEKKLLRSWFHGIFWAWSCLIVLFHTHYFAKIPSN